MVTNLVDENLKHLFRQKCYLSDMELNEFVEKFSECFVNGEAMKINAQTDFKKLDEWGSMIALIVIAMVNSDYGKTLMAEDLRAATTVEDLFELIRKK